MKKIMMSLVCLLSAHSAVYAMESNQQLTQMIVQSATQEALESVSNIESVVTNPKFVDEFFTLSAGHGKESGLFWAKNLKKSLSSEECVALADALTELYNWYAKMFALTMDVQALQTPAGQEAIMNHQMEMFQLLQKPFFAAVALRIMEIAGQLENDPTALDGVKGKFGVLMTNMLKDFKAELLAK